VVSALHDEAQAFGTGTVVPRYIVEDLSPSLQPCGTEALKSSLRLAEGCMVERSRRK
jgi:hypothetical protein